MQYDPKADVDELVTGLGIINGRHSSRPLHDGRNAADTDYGTVEPPTTHTKKKEGDESIGQNLSYKRNRDDLNDSGALPDFDEDTIAKSKQKVSRNQSPAGSQGSASPRGGSRGNSPRE